MLCKQLFRLLCIFGLLASCAGPDRQKEINSGEKKSDTPGNTSPLKEPETTGHLIKNDTSALEKKIIDAGLVDVTTIVPGVRIDLRYSTTNNFMQEDLYGTLEKLYLQPDVAKKLGKAQELLSAKDSTLHLLLFDGVRPLEIQQKMWDKVDLPVWKKGKFLSNPAYGSLHNYGAAVDLTICNANGVSLDMGTPYDDTAQLAYPEMENYFLAQKKLTPVQIKNRQLLRGVMYGAGFFGIQSEWWHFNSCTRDAAKVIYKRVD